MANDRFNKLITKKAVSFWDTKEGTTGMIVGLALLGGLGWAAYKIMPYVANLMENLFVSIVCLIVAIGLAYVILEGSLRKALWLRYKLLMRALTYSVIKEDPAGTLRVTQKLAKRRLEKVEAARLEVGGQV